MVGTIDFTGPFLKTERAAHHIDHLENIIRAHIRASAEALVPHRNPNRRQKLGRRLPSHTPTILGDALHNLRAALDHAYCVLIEHNGFSPDAYSKFPFANKGSRSDLEGSINGKKASPGREIIDYILNVIQPFQGGSGTILMALHDLDIADKHLVLLPTTQQFQIQDVVLENGMHFSGFSLSVSGGKGAMPIGGSPLKHGAKQTASVEICFGGGQPLEGQPIMPTLKSIARTVNSVLDDLKVIAEN